VRREAGVSGPGAKQRGCPRLPVELKAVPEAATGCTAPQGGSLTLPARQRQVSPLFQRPDSCDLDVAGRPRVDSRAMEIQPWHVLIDLVVLAVIVAIVVALVRVSRGGRR